MPGIVKRLKAPPVAYLLASLSDRIPEVRRVGVMLGLFVSTSMTTQHLNLHPKEPSCPIESVRRHCRALLNRDPWRGY